MSDSAWAPPASGPAVVDAHGGGWIDGSRIGMADSPPYTEKVGGALLAQLDRGWAVSIDYRLSYQAAFPAAVIDANRAVQWVRRRLTHLNFAVLNGFLDEVTQ